MKKLIFLIIFLYVFSVPALADNIYKEQYEQSGADKLYDILPYSAEKVIDNFEIDLENADWANKLTPESVFSQIWDFVKTGAETPLKSGGAMLGILLLISAANTFESFKPFSNLASYIFVFCSAAGVLIPLFSLIESSVNAVKGIAVLMDGFVPVYAGILALSGKAATATGMSFLLLFAAGLVGSLSSFVILPLMSCYLGVATVGSILPIGATNRLGDGIKKTAMWILSLTLTVFLGLISIQTSINRAADNLGLKTIKFMIGSFVPVAGGALSETLGTLIGSVGVLKSSVGMFGVVLVAAIVLPVVIELLIWRIILFALDISAELFGSGLKIDILKAADAVIAVLIGVMLFVAAIFIISLGIIAGGS